MIISSNNSLSLKYTVLSHGWFQLAPWKWDHHNEILSRIEPCPDDSLTLISCSQIGPKSLFVQIPQTGFELLGEQWINRTVNRWLSLDWDPTPAIELSRRIDPEISNFLQIGGGRFLRGTSFYEDCIKTILTINANWKFTRRMANEITMNLGGGVFPTPVKMIKAGSAALKRYLRLGFRAEVICEVSSQLLDKGIINEWGILQKEDLCYEDMIQFRGLGPYSVNHILMLMHDFRTIPVDSEVVSYCNQILKIESSEVQDHFARWGNYRFLGYKLRRIIDALSSDL